MPSHWNLAGSRTGVVRGQSRPCGHRGRNASVALRKWKHGAANEVPQPSWVSFVATPSSKAGSVEAADQGPSVALAQEEVEAAPGIDVVPSVAPDETADATGQESTRRTKLVCTIGPATCSREQLEMLADKGMSVARLNMCHGTHAWHKSVIDTIKEINKEKGYSIAIMVDTEGSEVHTEAHDPIKAEQGDEIVFTMRTASLIDRESWANTLNVSYEGFVEDVRVGDVIVVDGGMVSLEVLTKAGPDVTTRVVDPGIILSKANLTFHRNGQLVRGRNSMLPCISSKDWVDIDFAIENNVDFLAVSFVKNAETLANLKSYISMKKPNNSFEVVAKVESYDSLGNLGEIIEAADALMVARADLGAQIPLADVPAIQKEVVFRSRQAGKPVIVASQLMNSMIEFPIPTRAEVADVADVVRQQADAVMLSGETAVGRFPDKVMDAVHGVCTRVERWGREDTRRSKISLPTLPGSQDGSVSQELCAAAAAMADNLGAKAMFVYTRRGVMASLISRTRPCCPVYAFTDQQHVRQHLSMRWGVTPFLVSFDEDPESNIGNSFRMLRRTGAVASDDLVVVVSDIRPQNDVIRSIQVRHVK